MELILESFLRRLIQTGAIDVVLASGKRFRAGDVTANPPRIRFVTAAAQARFLRDPELAFGELYMDEQLLVEQGTIYDVLLVGMHNLVAGGDIVWLKLLNSARVAFRKLRQRNDPDSARLHVAHHYDLDGKLYDLFLDADRQYSCAYFEYEGQSLDEAQLAKKRHIAAKLLVEPGQKVLDIGCGWGGMALYLADFCRASVVGVTLSEQQLGTARQRANERGLARAAEFRLEDYRHVGERFDRIVSIGMLEHVGVGYFDAYFQKISELLTDDGVALVHSIGDTAGPHATNPWVDKYIFPGGYIPAISEIMPSIEKAGLLIADVEVLRLHYAETVRAWRQRFEARRREAAALYDERFCRMWEFYLASSEAGFRLGQMVVYQLQLAKRVNTLPLTRSYIQEREDELRATEQQRRAFRLAGE